MLSRCAEARGLFLGEVGVGKENRRLWRNGRLAPNPQRTLHPKTRMESRLIHFPFFNFIKGVGLAGMSVLAEPAGINPIMQEEPRLVLKTPTNSEPSC